MYTKHKATRLSYPWEPSRNANSGCSHEESRESFFLPLGKNSSEEIFFQTGRKGKVRRKGHPTPLHVSTQDNPFIGIIGWSSWFMMNSWSLVASLLGSYAPTLNHHTPWSACSIGAAGRAWPGNKGLGIGPFPLRLWEAIGAFITYRNTNVTESR